MLVAAKNAIQGTQLTLLLYLLDFPAGLSPFHLDFKKLNILLTAGANEIDIVISRRHVLEGNWKALYEEVRMFREKCGDAHMKTIFGDWRTWQSYKYCKSFPNLYDGWS